MKTNPLHTFFGETLVRYGQFFDDGTGEHRPDVHEEAFVSPHAVLIGDIRISARVFIAPNATLRADLGVPFFVGEESNLQDNTVFHADDAYVKVGDKHYAIHIGKRVTIAHQATIQGPSLIEDDCYVGIGARIISSILGKGCYVSHGAIVHHVSLPPGTFVPMGEVVRSQSQVDELGPLPDYARSKTNKIVDHYLHLVNVYRRMAAASGQKE